MLTPPTLPSRVIPQAPYLPPCSLWGREALLPPEGALPPRTALAGPPAGPQATYTGARNLILQIEGGPEGRPGGRLGPGGGSA